MSLVELIIAIVIVAVSVSGLVMVFQHVVMSSADPLIHKQAIASAESMLEEIERKAVHLQEGAVFSCTGAVAQNASTNTRRYAMCIDDYNGFHTDGIYHYDDGVPLTGLESYTLDVSVSTVVGSSGFCGGGDSRLITVTVTTPAPASIPVSISSYRCDYVPVS